MGSAEDPGGRSGRTTDNLVGGGVAGPVVQSGVVHGGIHIRQAPPPRIIPRHRRIGEALSQAGRDQEATEHLERARAGFAELCDDKDEAKVLVGLARLDARGGRTPAAIRRLASAHEVLRVSGSATYHADVLLASAEINEANGDIGAARTYVAEALALCRDVGGPYVERIRTWLARLDPPPNARSDDPAERS